MAKLLRQYKEKFVEYAKQVNNEGASSKASLFGVGAALVGVYILNEVFLELLAKTQLPQIATTAIAVFAAIAAAIVAAAVFRVIANKTLGLIANKTHGDKSKELSNSEGLSQVNRVNNRRKDSVSSSSQSVSY